MRGNVYISIPAADNAKALPSSITRYDWNEYTYNEEGEVETTTLVHPTWAEYGEKYKADFGAAVSVSVKDVEFIVYEITASWKDSEVSALLALGKGKAAPKYTVMTAEEARAFIIENTPAEL
jgi:hypothetical protein